MFKRERIKYLEKPVTSDEKEIAALIDTLTSAITTGNIQQLMSIISDSAQLAVPPGDERAFNKKEFEEYITALMPQVKNFSCSDIYIRTDGKNSNISCLAYTLFRNGRFKTLSRHFKCRKENGKWLLTETSYI